MNPRHLLFAASAACAVVFAATSCGEKPALPEPDAGAVIDAGTQADAGGQPIDSGAAPDSGGTPDAGTEDAGGEPPDAGESSDGGEQSDGGAETDAGTACDPWTPVLYQVLQEDWGWPVNWPACYSGPADCKQLTVQRFTNQNDLDNFYTQELQMTAPTVNFALAEVLVAYSCGCPTTGHNLKTQNVETNTCSVGLYTEFTHPDPDTCFTFQTFSRPFTTVAITLDAGVTETLFNTDVVMTCQ